jgi:Tol biopolymer transport system component
MINFKVLQPASENSVRGPARDGRHRAAQRQPIALLAIALVFLLPLFLLPLAGCGGGTLQSPPPPPQNQPTTISFGSQRALDGSAGANTNAVENIWVVKSDGSGVTPLTRLTASQADVRVAVWSPDGSKIAFWSFRALDGSDAASPNGVGNIWVMKNDGTGATPLTRLTAPNATSVAPVWSPDGSKIAFEAVRALDGSDAGGPDNIWVMNADGTGAAPLTKLTASTATSSGPRWSPDSSKILFVSRRALDGSNAGNTNLTSNVWVMKSDGTGATPLTKLTAAGALSFNAVWSPDGGKIAFQSFRALDGSDALGINETLNIWAMKADGSGVAPLTRLTAFKANSGIPVWSPDGSKIAFDSSRAVDGSDAANNGFVSNIWVMNADGSAATPLSKLTVVNSDSANPVWSRDAGKIAFESQRALDGSPAANTNNVSNIWVMSADGSGPVPLTKLTVVRADSFGPEWKP